VIASGFSLLRAVSKQRQNVSNFLGCAQDGANGSQGWFTPLGTKAQRRLPTVNDLPLEKACEPFSQLAS
jgi:hypothetical protein